MKDSGVEWLGAIPKAWEVRSLSKLLSTPLKYGANEAAEFDRRDWPRYLRITDLGADGVLREETFRSLPPDVARDYPAVANDILIARSGATVGKSFLVPEGTPESCFAGYLIRIRTDQRSCNSKFLHMFLNSDQFATWRAMTLTVATIENIGASKYSILPVPLPPVDEQVEIVAQVSVQIDLLDRLISVSRSVVDLLRERRAALITAAVTGKIDVRGEV